MKEVEQIRCCLDGPGLVCTVKVECICSKVWVLFLFPLDCVKGGVDVSASVARYKTWIDGELTSNTCTTSFTVGTAAPPCSTTPSPTNPPTSAPGCMEKIGHFFGFGK